MKRLALLLALFCSALMSIVSCDKPGSGDPSPEVGPADIPEEYGDFELAEGAVFMTEDIWNQFVEEDSEETKSRATVTMPAAIIGIPFESAGFIGQLYTSFELTATVDISRVRQVNTFEFKVNRKTGVSGGWDVVHEGNWELRKTARQGCCCPDPRSR